MIYLTFLSALLLSGIAAYYSIIGLASIFVGAFWPVVFMGSSLEFAKVITTSWLYRNWREIPLLLKSYLTSAVVILMLITSMGIFGYLSKSHLEQSSSIGPIADKVLMYDEKIKTLKENVDANKLALKQLDAAVDQVMARTEDAKGAERSVQIRKTQQKERIQLTEEITKQQKEISKLTEERAPLANDLRKAESDFGPIKYVAELIYGSSERDIIDKAVRVVIILIMIVFDPLAVLLLIAGNISLAKKQEEPEEPKKEVKKEPKKVIDEDVNPVYKRVQEKIAKLEAGEVDEPKPEPVKADTVQIRKENITTIDPVTGLTIIQPKAESVYTQPIEPVHVHVETHHSPGSYSVEKVQVETYDYDAALSFKEKENK
jgi:hypothetical protein